MRKVVKFLRLTPADRRLVIQAAFVMAAIRLGLWLLPFRTLRGILARLTPAAPVWREPSGASVDADRIAWAVTRVSRFVPAGTCLTQALAAQLLLRRRGLSACLRIGVARGAEAQFLAHAWVESQGRVVVGGPGVTRYTALPHLEGEEA